MNSTEIFQIVAGSASILSLLISLFIANRVMKITTTDSGSANVSGTGHTTAGRDLNVNQK
jgi:hypothetical protein